MLIGKLSLDNVLFIRQLMSEIEVVVVGYGGKGGAELLFECDFGFVIQATSYVVITP